MVLIWLQILFVVLNISAGYYQAKRFDVQQKRINHLTWFIWNCLALVPVWFLSHNLWLVVACGVQHLPVFNTALNFSRSPRRPIFYTHPEDPQGSKIDKLWGKYYPFVFFISLAALVGVQWLVFK